MSVFANGKIFRIESFYIFVLLMVMLYAFVPYEIISPTASNIIRFVAGSIFFVTIFNRNLKLNSNIFQLIIFLIFFNALAIIMSLSNKAILVILAIFISFYWYYVVTALNKTSAHLVALKILIYISLIAFIIQYILFVTGLGFHEIHGYLFPGSLSRTEDHTTFARLGGMYIEPGTFSAWIYVFFVMLIISDKKYNSTLGIFVSVAIILSASLWGGVAGFTIFIANIIYSKGFWKKIILILVLMLFVYFYLESDLYDFSVNKMFGSSISVISKWDVYEEFGAVMKNILFFGMGFDPNFCDGCTSPQDAGVFFMLNVVYGLLFSILLLGAFLFFAFKVGGFALLLLALPLLMSKLNYWDFALWIIIINVILMGMYKLKISN